MSVRLVRSKFVLEMIQALLVLFWFTSVTKPRVRGPSGAGGPIGTVCADRVGHMINSTGKKSEEDRI